MAAHALPKGVSSFIAIAEQLGTPFHPLKKVQRINTRQLDRMIETIREKLWILKDKRIAVWSLSFKPHTDDVRNSVAIELINGLAVALVIATEWPEYAGADFTQIIAVMHTPLVFDGRNLLNPTTMTGWAFATTA